MRTTDVAYRLTTAKLTPPRCTVAPNGNGWPRSISMSARRGARADVTPSVLSWRISDDLDAPDARVSRNRSAGLLQCLALGRNRSQQIVPGIDECLRALGL